MKGSLITPYFRRGTYLRGFTVFSILLEERAGPVIWGKHQASGLQASGKTVDELHVHQARGEMENQRERARERERD